MKIKAHIHILEHNNSDIDIYEFSKLFANKRFI